MTTYREAKKIVDAYETKKQERIERRLREENTKLIGSCWKYRNSYGSGEQWWLYVRITGIGLEGRELKLQEIQKTTRAIEIKTDSKWVYPNQVGLGNGYIRISEEEFLRETDKIFKAYGLGSWHVHPRELKP